MTVKELLEILGGYPPETLVVLARDAEGSTYSPPSEFSSDLYVPDSSWSGSIYQRDATHPDPSAVPCITLWPVN